MEAFEKCVWGDHSLVKADAMRTLNAHHAHHIKLNSYPGRAPYGLLLTQSD